MSNNILKTHLKEDLEKFESLMKTHVINDDIKDLLHLLELNNAPLSAKCLEHVKKNKLQLVYSDDLLNTSVRFHKVGEKVYINVSKFTKVKKESGNRMRYVIPMDQLYSLLLCGISVLYEDILNYNREYLRDVCDIYMEIVPKIFTKGGNFFADTDKVARFHFLLIYFLFSHNKTVISNVEAFAKNQSEIKEDDVKMLAVTHDLEKIPSMDFDTFLEKVLKEEFKFLKDFNPAMVIYNASLIFGAENVTLLDTIHVTGTVIMDCVTGNRPSLNVGYSIFKNLVKSNMYNNMISILAQKI